MDDTALHLGPGEDSLDGLTEAAEAIDAWVADSIAPERPIVVMGFSQGGLLAGEMLRVNPKRYAAAVSFSGFLAHGELPGDGELARLKPPMFYGHGSADDIFPKSELDAMNAFYASHTTLTEKIYPGMTHSINMPELRDVAAFLEHNPHVRQLFALCREVMTEAFSTAPQDEG